MKSEEAKKAITNFVGGKIVTTYKLRDWVFSRQRYWGEPLPLVFCEECRRRVENYKSQTPRLLIGGQANPKQISKSQNFKISKGEELNPGWIAVSDDKLPVKLPKVENYKPMETGESPLAAVSSWVNVKCPRCGGAARRETDTMPNWAGSSWYYIAYLAKRDSRFMIHDSRARRRFARWLPVDWYNGGMEHTTLHLLYSRFWHKFLFDLKLVPTSEPYAKRTSHGLILAEGGEKMSKSKGNVVNPDDIVGRFGADTLRIYEMFMGPFDQSVSWRTDSMVGARRFLERVWRLRDKTQSTVHKGQTKHKTQSTTLQSLLHQTVKKVSEDVEAMRFNTAVSTLMILVNALEKETAIAPGDYETLLTLLAPFAPHIVEELFSTLGRRTSIHAAL